jgi:hypothetical protein
MNTMRRTFLTVVILFLWFIPPVFAALPGDANSDGKVDGIDFAIWVAHYGQNASGIANGDYNTDGHIDGVDFAIWLSNYGKSEATQTPTHSVTNSPSPTVQATPTTGPLPTGTIGKIKTVFIIALEDADWAQVKASSSAPYINGTLLPNFAHAEGDTGGFHTSLGNYFMLDSGDSYGLRTTETPTSYRVGDSNNLIQAMKSRNITWKSYQEGLPSGVCYTGNSGTYAVDHNPFAFYNDMTGNPPSPTAAYCVAHVRPYSELASDIANNSVPQYNFIVPSPCNQGETGCPGDRVKAADTWLSQEVPKIMNSGSYKNSGVIFITWMENNQTNNTTPVGLIVVSPNAKKGYSNSLAYRHYSIIHSVQDIFAITPLIRHAATDANLSDLFTVYP